LKTRLVRVTGKVRRGTNNYFVAGFETNGTVIRAAPLLKFLIGKSDADVRALIRKNKWRATVLRGESAGPLYDELEKSPPPEQPSPSPAKADVVVDISCVVCGETASFGYGVSIRRGEPGEWYCGRHRPDKEHIKDAA